MSDVFFPDLNMAYDFVKAPYYNTRIVQSVNGRELRACLQPQPKFNITLNFPVLSQRGLEDEFKTLENFFIARRGSFDSFLFEMLDDNEATIIIRGDGSSTYTLNLGDVQLSNVEPVESTHAYPLMWNSNGSTLMWSTNGSDLMWDNSILYTVSKDGIVQFNQPINSDMIVTINVKYYYRCRFAEDSQQFTLFCEKLWKGEVALIASLGNHL